MTIKSLRLLLSFSTIISIAIFITACGEPKFKIKGEISGAADKSLVLEKSDFNGQWIAIDSTRTSGNGSFSMDYHAPASPEIYRLSLDGQYIYVPIDSIESITVMSSIDKFGTDFSLSGSEKAVHLEKFEKDLLALPKGISSDSLASFKKKVYSTYLRDGQGSIVSYYILTKMMGDRPLFDPTDHTDAKYFAAVATGFKTMRPNDPHTSLLENTTLNALKRKNSAAGKTKEIEAEEVTMFDIELPDEKGVNQKLSNIAGKGKPVVVIFSVLNHPEAPALNRELSQLYNSKGGNVEFYQVSLDTDQYAWRDAAVNLPWITVFEPEGIQSKLLLSYNVTDLPTYFIYNANGELSGRADSLQELKKKI